MKMKIIEDFDVLLTQCFPNANVSASRFAIQASPPDYKVKATKNNKKEPP
jgi:hypothetical protein